MAPHPDDRLTAGELLGPLVFAPVTAMLFWSQTSATRLMLVITVHMVVTAGFFIALYVLGPRMTRDTYVQVEDTWPLFTGAIIGALPWVLDPNHERGYVLLALAITVVLTSDTLFLAVRPSRVWPFLASFEGTSFAVYLFYRRSWLLAVFILLFMLHLIDGYRSVQTILNKLRAQQDASNALAHTDYLTQLQNRRGLARFLDQATSWPVEPVHLAVLDIDNFKQLNDRYGQTGGDAILQSVAAGLTVTLGPDWFLSRTGGDEFIAVSGTENAAAFEQRISRFSLGKAGRPGTASVTLSAGIAHGLPTDDLLSDASAALRIAKSLGKNRTIEVTSALRHQIREERKLAVVLERAIESKQIVMWAQPIVDLRTSEPTGFELLARWEHTDGRIIGPREFIHLAEDQGLTEKLGESVLQQALTALGSLPEPLTISANVSTSHFESPSFVPALRRLLAQSGVAPARLTIEVIESEFNDDDSMWLDVANQVRSMGVGLAIDDFGAGYSSLERLIYLPADQVKLDICMMELTETNAGRHLLGGIAAFGESDDHMRVVVEGVETEHQRRCLIDLGFTQGQGYLFAKPRPLPEILGDASLTTDDPAADDPAPADRGTDDLALDDSALDDPVIDDIAIDLGGSAGAGKRGAPRAAAQTRSSD